jgi:hypothetical protein
LIWGCEWECISRNFAASKKPPFALNYRGKSSSGCPLFFPSVWLLFCLGFWSQIYCNPFTTSIHTPLHHLSRSALFHPLASALECVQNAPPPPWVSCNRSLVSCLSSAKIFWFLEISYPNLASKLYDIVGFLPHRPWRRSLHFIFFYLVSPVHFGSWTWTKFIWVLIGCTHIYHKGPLQPTLLAAFLTNTSIN